MLIKTLTVALRHYTHSDNLRRASFRACELLNTVSALIKTLTVALCHCTHSDNLRWASFNACELLSIVSTLIKTLTVTLRRYTNFDNLRRASFSACKCYELQCLWALVLWGDLRSELQCLWILRASVLVSFSTVRWSLEVLFELWKFLKNSNMALL